MNQKLLLVILAVSLIPAVMSFGRGITGMSISGSTAIAQPEAQQAHPFLSVLVLLYVLITIVVLAIATSYLITLYTKKPTHTSPHKHLSKSLENIKFAFKGIRFAKTSHFAKKHLSNMSDDRISQYIVGIVALVGLIAILIIVF
jgi:hypothetical protein